MDFLINITNSLNKKTYRERVLVLITLLLLIFAIFSMVFFKNFKKSNINNELKQEITILENEIKKLNVIKNFDPNINEKKELMELKEKIKNISSEQISYKSFINNFINILNENNVKIEKINFENPTLMELKNKKPLFKYQSIILISGDFEGIKKVLLDLKQNKFDFSFQKIAIYEKNKKLTLELHVYKIYNKVE